MPQLVSTVFRWLPMILLSLPVAELLLDLYLYRLFGDRYLWWLMAAAITGIWLLLRAKETFGRSLRGMAGGDARFMVGSLWTLLAGARAFFAGLLLLFPGVLSDVVALVILLLPGRVISPVAAPMQAANDDVIEGEFREVKDDQSRLR